MANNELREQEAVVEFLQRLFGEVTELNDEELDLLYSSVAPGQSPTESLYLIAERAATHYRKQGKVPPEHVQAALAATRPQPTPGETKQSFLEKLAAPFTGPVSDPAFAHRGLKEITAEDRDILERLSDELRQDWKEGYPK